MTDFYLSVIAYELAMIIGLMFAKIIFPAIPDKRKPVKQGLNDD